MKAVLIKPIARLVQDWERQTPTPGLAPFGSAQLMAQLATIGIRVSADEVHEVLEYLETAGCMTLIKTPGPTDTIHEVYPHLLLWFV